MCAGKSDYIMYDSTMSYIQWLEFPILCSIGDWWCKEDVNSNVSGTEQLTQCIIKLTTVLGRNRYIYGLFKQEDDIKIVLISSGLSSVIVKTGPM